MRHFVTLLNSAFENPYAEFDREYDAKVFNEVLGSVSSVISVGLGGFVVVLCLLAAFVTVLDVLFMTVPYVHDKLSEILDRRRRDGESSSKVVLLSKQAIDAYEEAANTGGQAILIYMRKRIGYYIVLAVAIYFLVSGWEQIVHLVASFIVGILDSVGLI